MSMIKRLLLAGAFFCLTVTGCADEETAPAPQELFQLTEGVTADGVQAGDGEKEFREAYAGREILVSSSGEDIPQEVMPIRKIPYNNHIATMIANFFIDGRPMSPQDICEEEQIDSGDLFDLLSSEEYLRSHEVIYRYLIFYWEDGVIRRIASEELNYNETYEVPSSW